MASSDEEGEMFPDCVTDYEFVNQENEYVSLACLPLLWQKGEVDDNGKIRVFLSGFCDDGLQKIYKEVVAWRYELSYVQPEISVMFKGRWAKLLKARRQYEAAFRSILITVNCLHYVKHNPEVSEDSLWSQLSIVFSNYEVPPSEVDIMNHIPLIKDATDHDRILKHSEFVRRILSGQPIQGKVLQVEGIPAERPEFIVDEDTYEPCEDDEFCEQEEDLFDTCCSFCDNGGDILCCEGRCMRSFHACRQTGDYGEETCEGLGLSEAQVKTISHFICKNCRYQRHQCFICGKLGSSDITSNAEVFPCIAGNCGRFYHPKCVVKELLQRNDTQIENLEEKIAAGESFVCPAHRCFSCKQVENRTIPEMQFAVCRRCPKSYHRKCLPREIVFDTEAVMEILPRAWDGLLPKRILIYCLDHEIVPRLGTPLRNHICFPNKVRVEMHTPETLLTGLTVEQKKRKLDHSNLLSETAARNTPKKQTASEPARLVDRHISGSSFDGQKKAYPNKLTNASTAHLKHLSKPYTSSNVSGDDPLIRHNTQISVKKMSVMKPGSANLYSEKLNTLHSAKPPTKKQGFSSPVADIEMEKRITALIEKVDSSFNVDEFMKLPNITSVYNKSSKDVIDKTLTKGKVEVAVKAVREALQKLDNGGSVDDAKIVCSAELLRQVPLWKMKLKLYLAPFFHGMHYSSYGRHFTKSEKLQEIVNRLHNYVEDGDTIVDFCCGANEFSCLMKEKLDSVGKKKCSFKNFDLFPSKNDFNFEQKNWFDVDPKDLPRGSQLIMGLNPPFGYKASLANKFIDKALQFKPKLLILIVPPETQRLDCRSSKNRHLRYDLLWEDQYLLSGESFYFPGAFNSDDKQISQWNNITPPLYLWSHPDWTRKHREIEIANRCGHSGARDKLPNRQPPSSKHLPEDQQDVHGDFMNVYGNLPNVVNDVPGPMDEPKPNLYKLHQNLVPGNNIYGHPMSNVNGHHMSNVYGHNMSHIYSRSGQVCDNYGNILSVENLVPGNNIYGHPMSNVNGHHMSNVYGHNMSHIYSRSGQVCDNYGNILSVEDKYSNIPRVENKYGNTRSAEDKYSNISSVENPGPTNVMGSVGRNVMFAHLNGREDVTCFHRGDAPEEDMEISPINTPSRSLF